MFGFFKKSKLTEDNSVLVFDLKPMYDSLTFTQKSSFNTLADGLHFEIHRVATLSGFEVLLHCAIGKPKNGSAELITSSVMQFLSSDPDMVEQRYDVFFPICEFESVKALRGLVDNRYPQNNILSAISGEAAVRVLRGDFYDLRRD